MFTIKKSYLVFDKPEDEERYKKSSRIFPDTYFSPKDKVSNLLWNNGLKIGKYIGIPTIYKSENFGCIVKLDYDAILNSNEVITGAELSQFDRLVYDSVATLYAAGNKMFPLKDIWRVMNQDPNAKFTEVERDKLFKSLRHIAKFWFTIVTDNSEKPEVWEEKNSKSNEKNGKAFKSERKFYKKLESIYTGQLLYFQIIGRRCIEIINDGQNIIEKEITAEILELGFCPILYQYARAKGQISSIPIKLLDTSDKSDKQIVINRSCHTNELVTFLAREIDTMKRNSAYSKIILLERLYIIDGIDDVQTNANSLKQKKKYTRGKIDKILTRFKTNGLIRGHKFHKKNIGKTFTFYSVGISV